MKKIIPIIVLMLAAIIGCKNSATSADETKGDTLKMNYSSLLTIQQCEGYMYAKVKDPWDTTRVLHSYVLVEDETHPNPPQGRELGDSRKSDESKALKDTESTPPWGELEGVADVIHVPLKNAVVYTSVHCSLIDQLGAYSAIKGVCDVKFIYLDKVARDVKSGKMADLGEGMNPNIEAIMDLSPDAILLSPFQNSGSYGKLGKLGIPLVECADYMEVSPLARAEWMRFYGILFGKSREADSLFSGVEKRYNDLKTLASKATEHPSVFMDLKYGNQWYVPGGNSTVGIMLKDAGADYMYKDRVESGSVPLDPESVFDHCIDAKYWLIKYNQDTDKTYDEVKQDYGNYAKFSAFKNKNIFSCNLSKVPYYEEVPFHPDILLKDYIKIFHPELLPDYMLRYYKKM